MFKRVYSYENVNMSGETFSQHFDRVINYYSSYSFYPIYKDHTIKTAGFGSEKSFLFYL